MRRFNQLTSTVVALLAAIVLSGCGLKEFVHANDSRYGVPGVFDTPLDSPLRTHFINNFLGQYRITHEWTYKGCRYASYVIPVPGGAQGLMSPLWGAFDVLEQDGKTLQRVDNENLRDMSQYFRETYTTPAPISANGRITYSPDVVRTQPGFRPLCGDRWLASHHFMALSINLRDLNEYKGRITRAMPHAEWRTEIINGNTWHVQQVPMDQVAPNQPNTIGAPYSNWVTEIGNTGYLMILNFGASQRSFDSLATHKAIEDLFMRIVQSVTIEPIEINQNQ